MFQKATANWHYFIKYHRHFKLSQWDDTFLEKVWYCPTDGVRCLIEREASTKWKSPYLFSPYKNSEQSPDLCGWRVWNFEKLRDRKGTVDTEVLFFYWQWGDYTWSFFQYFLVIIQSVINFSLSELRLKKKLQLYKLMRQQLQQRRLKFKSFTVIYNRQQIENRDIMIIMWGFNINLVLKEWKKKSYETHLV